MTLRQRRVLERYFLNAKTPGIFSFILIGEIIRSYIHGLPNRKYKNRKTISFNQLCKELFEDFETRKRYNQYLPIIAQELNISKNEAANLIKERLYEVYTAIVGEAIFENMINKTKLFSLSDFDKELDFIFNIDIEVKNNRTGNILDFQIKNYSYLENPRPQHLKKMKEEQKRHKKYGRKVEYVFFNYDFNDRKFWINGKEIKIYGYGNSNIDEFEKVILEVFEKHYGPYLYF